MVYKNKAEFFQNTILQRKADETMALVLNLEFTKLFKFF